MPYQIGQGHQRGRRYLQRARGLLGHRVFGPHPTVVYDFTTINLHRRSRTLGRQEKVGVEAMTNHLGGQPPGELEQRIGLRGQPGFFSQLFVSSFRRGE